VREKVGNFHVFEAAVSRATRSEVIDDLLALLAGERSL